MTLQYCTEIPQDNPILRTSRFLNEIGNVYGRLTVKGLATDKPRPGAFWVCECDCGNIISTSGGCLRSGNSRSCGCLRIDNFRASNTKPKGVAAENRVLSQTQRNALSRGYGWHLTRDEAVRLIYQNCFYCDAKPSQIAKSQTGSILYNGIDRIDNARGYTTDNVVACCFTCNRAKDTMSLEQFKAWISRLYLHITKEK